jgi:hypothetical protein
MRNDEAVSFGQKSDDRTTDPARIRDLLRDRPLLPRPDQRIAPNRNQD